MNQELEKSISMNKFIHVIIMIVGIVGCGISMHIYGIF